jgi:hypothetical protein
MSKKLTPLPENVSTDDLADLIGVTPARLRSLGKRGVLHSIAPDVWPLRHNIRAFVRSRYRPKGQRDLEWEEGENCIDLHFPL